MKYNILVALVLFLGISGCLSQGGTSANSIAFGDGLSIGVPDSTPVTFTIQAVDTCNHDVTTGGATFSVSSSDSSITFTITDNGDGTYTVAYTTPSTVGETFTITVSYQGTPLIQGPSDVTVVLSGTFGFSEASGPGLNYIVPASTVVTFTIQARDDFGNDLTTGGATWDIEATDPSISFSVTDNNDGTYTVTYTTPATVGESYEILIQSGPYEIFVGGLSDITTVEAGTLGNSAAFGPGLGPSVPGSTLVSFTIQARDVFGNNLTSGGATWDIEATDSSISFSVLDNGDGTYTVSYTSPPTGTQYEILIEYDPYVIAEGGQSFITTV